MPVYAVNGSPASEELGRLVDEMGVELEQRGFARGDDPSEADLVLNVVDPERPRPFRRKSRGTYSATIIELPSVPDQVLKATYPMLVRSLANIVMLYVPNEGVWFTTMEQGNYRVEPTAQAAVERLDPLARSRLIIDNEFRTDLEPELWDGDEITEEIQSTGVWLGRLGLLPAPFPIEELLDERELRHVKRLYGIGGLSYGNLSARKDERRFWMSASGVDKTLLETPGRDILLVSDYDEQNGRMVISVPPGIEPRRVSVDAIEHWMIYQEHPDVGAILHVHAWMDGIAATEINYPCGTEELARSVAELVALEPDPSAAVIGLRNHGITATGRSLGEIIERIEPKLMRQVPMT